MRTRKTIPIVNVKNAINDSITWERSREAKRALCMLLEDILMATESYHGFGWNLSTEESKEVAPGDEKYYNRHYI